MSQAKKANKNLLGYIVLAVATAVIVVAFVLFADNLKGQMSAQQLDTLETAIRKVVVHSYAVNGYYPQSFEEIEAEYGISYDKEAYVVRYSNFASNLLPEITVIEIG